MQRRLAKQSSLMVMRATAPQSCTCRSDPNQVQEEAANGQSNFQLIAEAVPSESGQNESIKIPTIAEMQNYHKLAAKLDQTLPVNGSKYTMGQSNALDVERHSADKVHTS